MSYVEAVELLRDSPIKSQLLIKKANIINHLNSNQSSSLMNVSLSHSSQVNHNYVDLSATPCLTKSNLLTVTNYNNNQLIGNQSFGPAMARKQLFPDDPIPPLSSASDIMKYSNENNTFIVTLIKNMRGLGLSIVGGIDTRGSESNSLPSQSSPSTPSIPSQSQSSLVSQSSPSLVSSLAPSLAIDQLIRIKRVFPSDPASNAGLIPGDIILEANGTPTIGMTQVVS